MRLLIAVLLGIFGCGLMAFTLSAGMLPASRIDSMPWLGALQSFGPFAGLILMLLGALWFTLGGTIERRRDARLAAEEQYALTFADAREAWRQGQRQHAVDMLAVIAPVYPPAADTLRRIQARKD